VLARRVFVDIVGFPDFVFTKLRQLHDSRSVDEPPSKRGKATGSFAEPVCASSATSVACGSCAARCVSCEAGCTCTEWDMTNCAELDGLQCMLRQAVAGARDLGRFQRAAGLRPPPPRDGPGCAYCCAH
jgi:hypothetical protein